MGYQKVAFVTGASSGMGYYSCIELAKRGYKVYGGARRLDSMKPLEAFGITPIELDVTSSESILKAKAIIEANHDKLDVLFNNAGIYTTGSAIEVSDDILRRIYEVNLFGPIRLTREFSSLVIKARGVFAFNSSTAAVLTLPFRSVYSSSKIALSTYASTLAVEVDPFGVKVVDFLTGGVNTPIYGLVQDPLKSDSLYIVDGINLIEESGKAMIGEEQMPVQEFVVKAVNDIEYAAKGGWFFDSNFFRVYRGSLASTVHLVTYFPRWFSVALIVDMFKLSKGFKSLKKKSKKEHSS